VVTLRLIEGYSTAETAEALNIPQGTALSRLARAQKKLQKILSPQL
jgi:DNA-directed RNA polymerase specialized sigma24 family protein